MAGERERLHPPASEPHGAPFVDELAVALERLTLSVDELGERLGLTGAARLPYRNSMLSNLPYMARAGGCRVTWIHAVNEQGSADAYLQLYDEYDADAVAVGLTPARLTLWLPAGGGLDDPWIPPIEFSRGVTVAATATRDAGGAPGAPILLDLATIPLPR